MSAATTVSAIVAELAPTGTIRAAINTGNPVLARKDRDGGDPTGVSVDLAYEIGRRLETPVTLVAFDTAGDVFAALARDEWDLAFLAIEPVRAERIAFSAPYVHIEGTYVVRAGSALTAAPQVDGPGVRIAVATGAAYDLYLTRTLRHAALVRAHTSEGAFAMFERGEADAVAGVRQALQASVGERGDLRILADRFMAIEQAVAVPRTRAAAAAYLQLFIAEAIASGFVARTVERQR